METENPYIRIQRFQGRKESIHIFKWQQYIYSEVYIFDINTNKFKQIREKIIGNLVIIWRWFALLLYKRYFRK